MSTPEERAWGDLNAELARLAYAAYGESVGHKNYQGLPMPAFDDLPILIQFAWGDAAMAVYTRISPDLWRTPDDLPQRR